VIIAGVAVLPQAEDAQPLVEFRTTHDEIEGPSLGMTEHPPHTSILQCPFREDTPWDACLRRIRSALSPRRDCQMSMTEIAYQPVGWLFLNLAPDAWLRELQEVSLEVLAQYIAIDAIDTDKDISGYTSTERDSYLRYGYRYVGESFLPHITIGRIEDELSVEHLNEDFVSSIGKWTSQPRSLIFYSAGPFGVVQDVLGETPWKLDEPADKT
jgi:hypothetical protein